MADWLTVSEAAAMSGYHENHLRRLIRGGKIKAVKKGAAWWVDQQSLVAYLRTANQSDDKRKGPK